MNGDLDLRQVKQVQRSPHTISTTTCDCYQEDGIHVLFDLTGFTNGSHWVFGLEAAPARWAGLGSQEQVA